jgi:hypothetical protein
MAITFSTTKPIPRGQALATGTLTYGKDVQAYKDGHKSTGMMILGRDLDLFCKALLQAEHVCPGFAKLAKIVIAVAPLLDHQRPRYQDDTRDLFSETTQKTLLAPFHQLSGLKNVQIHGPVLPKLAKEIKDTMGRDEWDDPDAVLKEMEFKKWMGTPSIPRWPPRRCIHSLVRSRLRYRPHAPRHFLGEARQAWRRTFHKQAL